MRQRQPIERKTSFEKLRDVKCKWLASGDRKGPRVSVSVNVGSGVSCPVAGTPVRACVRVSFLNLIELVHSSIISISYISEIGGYIPVVRDLAN